MTENEIGTIIIDAAYEVHFKLGPGLLESAYQKCLEFELIERGLKIKSEVHLSLKYKQINLDCGFRIDLWAEDKVIIDTKTVSELKYIHTAQLLT